MSTRTITLCDECGAERGVENHWFSVVRRIPQFHVYLFDAARDERRSWSLNDLYDLCGRECAQKAFERWMQTGSIEKEGETR